MFFAQSERQVSHTYKTAGKIIVFGISVLKVLEGRQEIKRL
jgi:hypothetical protein